MLFVEGEVHHHASAYCAGAREHTGLLGRGVVVARLARAHLVQQTLPDFPYCHGCYEATGAGWHLPLGLALDFSRTNFCFLYQLLRVESEEFGEAPQGV